MTKDQAFQLIAALGALALVAPAVLGRGGLTRHRVRMIGLVIVGIGIAWALAELALWAFG